MSTYHSPRRNDAAAATRAAILESAESLFLTEGYGNVTVPQIAKAARVAVQTVYSSTGGKASILAAILEPVVNDPAVEETLSGIGATQDPRAVIGITAAGTRNAHERHWDVVWGLLQRGSVESTATEVLDAANAAYVAALTAVADRLIELGALRPGLDRRTAVDVLWFHLGHRAWLTLVGDRGWTFERTQEWLTSTTCDALLA